MQKIVPNLWFDRNAVEAGEFYAQTFRDASTSVRMRYPESGLPDFQKEAAGLPLVVDVTIGDYRLALINADSTFRPDPAISMMVNFDPAAIPDARTYFDEVWAALTDGGQVLMPAGEYPFSQRYGWVADRYGVNWQLILADPEGDPRPFVMPAFMFGADVQNQARAAIDTYIATLPDSSWGMAAEYPEQTGPAEPGALMFADFQMAGQWFVAMDSGVEQPSSFTPGVSLQIDCDDQAEIDRLWDALSANPEAEQCGWCADRFGVSWQVVPVGLDSGTMTPAGYQAMLGMKKIDIAKLGAAG
ncbi:VOC family protein [Gordonia zhaorongruii]|uniref:VOC family protein n=1 Tax=Gordonia zhaorongruii TaxID=2597659 RepID=UPI00104DA2DC|nr:VOC family protein [Gordonia zhaorongruii]